MKYFFLLLVFLVFIKKTVIGQNHKTTITLIAQQIGNATLKQDYSFVLDHTYPKVISMRGGKDSILANIRIAFSEMRASGISIKDVSIGEPGDEIKINKFTYSIIPEKITLNMKGDTFITFSSLLGVSTDDGNTWWFIDAGDPDSLKEILPDISKLGIPKATIPILMPKQ